MMYKTASEYVEVKVSVSGREVASAIERGKFSGKEIADIQSACYSVIGAKTHKGTSLWDIQWQELVEKLKSKYSNPQDFEEKIKSLL